jgi:hypothetical protein
MDLFDLGCYFAHLVPVQSLSNPLLRFSACAYAAKQISRVRGRKAVVGGIVNTQAQMELYPHPETVDWAYIGAKYYDRAISLLMEELSNSNSGKHDLPMTPMPEETFSPQGSTQSSQSTPSIQANKRRRLSRPAHTTNADETLAAAAILCVYEFLDNANSAWARHLSGTKSLFDLAENEGMMPVQSPTSPGEMSQRIKPSRARKATFWNFARQDFLAACEYLPSFTRTRTLRCSILTLLYKSSTKVRQDSTPKTLAFGEPLDCILMSKDLSSRATRKISITQRDK